MIENLRNTSGIGFVIIAAFFWSSPSAGFAATPKAGFDCSKAASAMEKLICGDAKLAAADAELAAQFASVRDRFDPARRASLLNGQRIWLKLREQACPPEAFIAVGGVIGCLQSVYGERLRELHEQSLLQNDENANPQAPHVNLDTVLDAERDLAAYFPRDMSTMHHTVGDARVGERVPATCRELFTLTRGTWTYSSDNIGISSEQSAVSKCNFALAAAQKWPGVGPSTDEAMFEDVTNYSWEFGLLSGSTDYDGKDIRTFAQEQAAGRIRIERKNAVNRDDADCQADSTLVVSTDNSAFCFNGWSYLVHRRQVGDFTHHGRREALMSITALPGGMTTLRFHMTLVAYYDQTTQTIRPPSTKPAAP